MVMWIRIDVMRIRIHKIRWVRILIQVNKITKWLATFFGSDLKSIIFLWIRIHITAWKGNRSRNLIVYHKYWPMLDLLDPLSMGSPIRLFRQYFSYILLKISLKIFLGWRWHNINKAKLSIRPKQMTRKTDREKKITFLELNVIYHFLHKRNTIQYTLRSL